MLFDEVLRIANVFGIDDIRSPLAGILDPGGGGINRDSGDVGWAPGQSREAVEELRSPTLIRSKVEPHAYIIQI